MLFSTLLSLAAIGFTGVSATKDPNYCYEDNCNRAVQRTWQGPAVFQQHMSDCAKNLACSTTPAAFVTTQSATVTQGVLTITVPAVTQTATDTGAKSACNTNTAIPADQKDQCENNFASYASACKCAPSYTPINSVAPVPTSTAYVTATVPSSIVYVVASAA